MYKNRYFYNPDSLRFEKAERSLSQKLKRISLYLLIVMLISVLMRTGFEHYRPSPKIDYYRQKNEDLKLAFNQLQNKISRSESLLLEIQKRDDRVYRSVFDLEPVPGSVREAGSGGSGSLMTGLLNYDGLNLVSNTDLRLGILSKKVSVQSWSLTDLLDRAKSHNDLIRCKPAIHPISPADSFWLTSSYGYRKDPFHGYLRMHPGIDLAGPVGLKIYATGDGVVIASETSRYGYGKEVVIDHGFGYMTRYAHLHRIAVNYGQKVKRGQYLGNLGNTGRSTGPHLHYEILHYGKSRNPFYFFYENLSPEEYNKIVNFSSN